MKYLIIIVFTYCFSSLNANSIVFFRDTDNKIDLTNNYLSVFTDSTKKISINDILKRNNLFRKFDGIIPTYFINDNWHWTKFEVCNLTNNELVLDVNNITINNICVYLTSDTNSIQFFDSLNWTINPKNRFLKTWRNAFLLKLSRNKIYSVYIKTFKPNGTLKIPLTLWARDTFNESEKNSNSEIVFLIGIVSVLCFVCLMIFFNTKEKRYLYYMLYIFSLLAWRSFIEGYFIKFLFKNFPKYTNPIYGNVLLFFVVVFFLLFIKEFLLSKNKSPKIHYTFLNILLLFLGILFVLFLIFGGGVFSFKWYSYLYFMCIISCIILTLIYVLYGIKRREYASLIYLISTTPLFIFSFITLSANATFLSSAWQVNYSVYSAIVFEIFVLFFGLALDFRNYISEQKQKEVLLIQAAQKEKERISRDLHDNVGGQLSFVLFSLDGIKSEDKHQREILSQSINESVRIVINNLRETIWAISDESINIQNFSDKLKVYVRSIFKNSEIKIIFKENLIHEQNLNSVVGLNLYRICQEIINNIFKHSNAKELQILITSQNNVTIVISDNGKGFNINDVGTDSFGLSNIKARAEDAGIVVDVKSHLNVGTTYILIV